MENIFFDEEENEYQDMDFGGIGDFDGISVGDTGGKGNDFSRNGCTCHRCMGITQACMADKP